MALRIIRNLSLKNLRFQKNVSFNNRTMASEPGKEDLIIISDLINKVSKKMGVDSNYSPLKKTRADLQKYLPKSQNELPPRSMKDSYIASLIPLSSDPVLRDKYTTFLGSVRFGRLLEDMDMFAVMVAHKHIYNPNLPEGVPFPNTLVTALVDRIDFTDFIPKPQDDIKMSGHVSWVGKSSMEVVVWLEQKLHGNWHVITKALFMIASRDPTNTKSAVVNSLVPKDDKEKKILAGGETRKMNRLKLQKQDVTKVIPDQEEQKIIHDLYVKTKQHADANLMEVVLPSNGVWMEDCKLSNTIFSQPENRNLHNTVFGGFIMRQASELTWVLGYRFSKYRPKFKSIHDINFNKPIAVNSLIHMHAFVVYTYLQYIQVIVYVETFDPYAGKSDTTNTLHFTIEVPEIVRQVYPKTYQEAMMYVDGRRHFIEIMTPSENLTSLGDTDMEPKSKL